MKILISPSKTIDFDSNLVNKLHSKPQFLKQTNELVNILKTFQKEDIAKLMKISDNLSKLNYDRFQSFTEEFNLKNSKQAILIFKGDVYEPIKVKKYDNEDFAFMQENLRIISGLYGILRPMDIIKPYRLEMSTRLKNNSGSDLYKFWGNKLVELLNNEVKSDEVIINLASNEYFKAINKKISKAKILDIEFKENKSGQYKIIGIMAKKARGNMVNYIVKNRIDNYNELKNYNVDNYTYSEELSSPEKLSFVR